MFFKILLWKSNSLKYFYSNLIEGIKLEPQNKFHSAFTSSGCIDFIKLSNINLILNINNRLVCKWRLSSSSLEIVIINKGFLENKFLNFVISDEYSAVRGIS